MIFLYILGGLLFLVLCILALIGADQIYQARKLPRWYERRDRIKERRKKIMDEQSDF